MSASERLVSSIYCGTLLLLLIAAGGAVVGLIAMTVISVTIILFEAMALFDIPPIALVIGFSVAVLWWMCCYVYWRRPVQEGRE